MLIVLSLDCPAGTQPQFPILLDIIIYIICTFQYIFVPSISPVYMFVKPRLGALYPSLERISERAVHVSIMVLVFIELLLTVDKAETTYSARNEVPHFHNNRYI